jgi:hypothetical protein
MFECLLSTLARVCAVEIKRECVEKLQLLVILEQVLCLDPFRGLRILGDLSLQPVLPLDLARQHPLG